jgi:hypothetical protein
MGGHAIICVTDQAGKKAPFKSIANSRQHNALIPRRSP